ncbi:MAG: lamin tail domain-containing protein [Candidatus Bipolaricaulia bacterium]
MNRMIVAVSLFAAFVGAVAIQGAGAVEGVAQIVLNEVELNPQGRDAGNEWVELLNLSDEEIDLAGWVLTYSYRAAGEILISEEPLLLGPGERYVFAYPRLMLRNDDKTVIELRDLDGNVIDKTSVIRDEANDAQTWQRVPDGGDPVLPDFWVFGKGTKGKANE